MNNPYRFEFRSAYMLTAWFDVIGGPEGRGVLEFRSGLRDYERSILNYDAAGIEADVVGAIGLLHWEHSVRPVSIDMLDAFNEWRLRSHAEFLAMMDDQPEKYGLDATDPLRTPPMLAWAGAQYIVGKGWTITARSTSVSMAEVRGRADYETDVSRRPRYPNGEERRSWGLLGEIERETWRRPYKVKVVAA